MPARPSKAAAGAAAGLRGPGESKVDGRQIPFDYTPQVFRSMAYVFDQLAHATERLSRSVIIAGSGYSAGSTVMVGGSLVAMTALSVPNWRSCAGPGRVVCGLGACSADASRLDSLFSKLPGLGGTFSRWVAVARPGASREG